ncbi:MAG: type II secretion system secretin GspD [Nannocystaceae bacterium]|nr:type II secretion system secretin GspD [bacterium]
MTLRRSFPVAARASVGLAAAMALGMPITPAASAAPPATRPSTSPSARPSPTASPSRGTAAPPGAPAGGAAVGRPAATAAPGGELSGDEGGALGRNSCRKQPRGAKFRITLPEEAELKDLVNWMMSISCQKFIWDPKVRGGKVTILSPEPVTVEEAYAAFYAALQTMGLTVEPSGKYFKIVESTGAESRTLPVYGPGGRAPANDRFVTQLIRPKGADVAEITGVLNKLKTKAGAVETAGDLIILTDTGSSVKRLMRIIREIDDPEKTDAEKIFFFQLQAADPEETAETIREIFGEKDSGKKGARGAAGNDAAGSAAFSRVVVDDRTGTLIVVAPEDDYQVIRRLIERLDVPLAGGGGRIHVYKLKNADPEEVANVLTQLGTGAKATANQNNRRGNNRSGGANTNGNNAAGAAELFSGEIKVTADPATRSLVILASTSDFKALLSVIEELDRPRKQVYIEVYLLELTTGNVLSGGAGGHFGSPIDAPGGEGLGFVSSTPTPEQSTIVLNPSVLSGLAAGVIGPQVPNSSALLGTSQDIPAFGVVIQALHELNDVNFVAEPHLYTADNHEASIEVGRNVPTPGALSFGGGAQGGGGLVPLQSVQRQDVTLNVKVTPHVNDGDQLTLDIEMENNDIESISETLGVTTTKRRLKLEQVVARDDQPVVLGGLMQEVERMSTSQVPGLGQIPLLGWLFKSKRRERTKVNLMMILVPHILETPDDVRRIHERRMKERLEFLERNTAFKRRDLDININYRKKSGLLSAVNAEAIRMSEEDVFRQQAEMELQQTEITGELGLSPSFAEEAPEPSDSGASPVKLNPSSSTSTGTRKSTGAAGNAKKGKKRRKNKGTNPK